MNQIVMIELLKIAQKHRAHLESRGKQLALMLPLAEERIASFTEQDVILWDAWINRFCQLQDHMGMKLFDAFISFVGHDPLYRLISYSMCWMPLQNASNFKQLEAGKLRSG